MKSLTRYITVLIVTATCLNSCGIKQNTQSQPTIQMTNATKASEWLDEIENLRTYGNEIKISGHANINLNGSALSSRINISVSRGNGMRLSLRPFPIVEAARVYLQYNQVELYDMIHEVKCILSYQDLSERLGYQVSYPMVEHLLMGELMWNDVDQAQLINGNGQNILHLTSDQPYDLFYHLNASTLFDAIRLIEPGNQRSVYIQYIKDTSNGFPTKIDLHIPLGEGRKAQATLQYRHRTNDSNAQDDLSNYPRGNYESVTLEQLIEYFK